VNYLTTFIHVEGQILDKYLKEAHLDKGLSCHWPPDSLSGARPLSEPKHQQGRVLWAVADVAFSSGAALPLYRTLASYSASLSLSFLTC